MATSLDSRLALNSEFDWFEALLEKPIVLWGIDDFFTEILAQTKHYEVNKQLKYAKIKNDVNEPFKRMQCPNLPKVDFL